MNKLLSLVLLLTFLLPAKGLCQQTKILTADKHNEYGLVYSLPLTELRIKVTATRTIKKAGPFYQYAKKYLGTDKVIKEDEEVWKIDKVEVSPYGVADTEQRYLMQLKSGSTTFISVAEDGMLLAINKRVEEPAAVPQATPARKSSPFKGNEYLQFVNEDFIASQSSAKRAQLLSESLMEVRDSKVALSRGTAETMPTDGRQLELMLSSLAQQEKAFTQAFAGMESSETFTSEYVFRPDKEGKTVLFRFSDFSGFREADDYSGAPVYISVADVVDARLPEDEQGQEKKLPKDAVIYALPGSARIAIEFEGRNLFSETIDIAQFGTTFGLSPSLFSAKKNPSFATFNPVTGALMEIGTVTE